MTNHSVEPSPRLVHHVRTSCRACGQDQLTRFLVLGPQPLANANLRDLSEAADEPAFPLDVYFCESCSLVQLADVIDPELLFRNYIYVTGTSETIAAHNVKYARTVADLLGLGADDLVVEVASNDGSLLTQFRELGVRTLGVEPAANIAEIARGRGIETVNEFFNGATGAALREARGPARAVIGNNVLAHVDDTQDFLRGAKALIAGDGLVIVEVPYARMMLERLEYDTVYHEHLCYFSVTSLLRLCDVVGLTVVRVDEVTVHGGSLRVYAGLLEHYGEVSADVTRMADAEREIGLTSLARWQQFASDVETQRSQLRDLLLHLKQEGMTVAGYGAPAKGNTLLNYCDIGTDLVPYTVDRSALKVGTYTPGMHLPVLPADTLRERQPDFVLILAWNFAEEIMRQQQAYRDAGGQFIVPIPKPVVI
ncbi:MAG: class I SAM-dependent methyltransferase [bacterium]